MKPQRTLSVLRRHFVLLIVSTLVCGAAGLSAALLLPPSYTARTELFVSVPTSGDPYEMRMASDFVKERIQTYVGMVDSRSVLEPVIADLDLDTDSESLAQQVEAFSDPETVLISVEARADDEGRAARLATAVAASLRERIELLENPGGEKSATIELVEANTAVPPPQPDGLPRWTFVPIGLLIGLGIGAAIAMLRRMSDDVVRTKEDLGVLSSAPLLAVVPEDRRLAQGATSGQPVSGGARGEAIVRLRTNLRFAQVDDDSTVVLLTSAQAEEGKTTLSIDLAIAAARAGQRVALVDADLRKPRIAVRLGLEGAAGLTTALLGGVDPMELLQPWGEHDLSVLASGEVPPNPAELLETHAMAELVSELARGFDLVVLDGPPLLPVADSLVLSRMATRVIVVAAAGHVKSSAVSKAIGSLEELGAPIGLVLNRARPTAAEHDRNEQYGIGRGPGADRSEAGEPDGDARSPVDRCADSSALETRPLPVVDDTSSTLRS